MSMCADLVLDTIEQVILTRQREGVTDLAGVRHSPGLTTQPTSAPAVDQRGDGVRETFSMPSGLSDPAVDTFDKPVVAHPQRHWTMTETLVYTPKSNRAPGSSSEYANTNFFCSGCSSRLSRIDPPRPRSAQTWSTRPAWPALQCRTPTVRYVRTLRISLTGDDRERHARSRRCHGTRTVATNAAVDEQV